MFLCICNQVREHETDRHHLIGTKCGRCLDLIYAHRGDKGNWRMTEFTTTDGITDVKWKHSAHEDRWYIEKKARNHNAIAEFAQDTRRRGGTKTIDDQRVVATIPEEIFYSANAGLTHGGKYKGFMSADHESQDKLLTQFMLEDDVKIFCLNDNYRV